MAQLEKATKTEPTPVTSRLLEYLPAVYQQDGDSSRVLEKLLYAFETVLLGRPKDLERIISGKKGKDRKLPKEREHQLSDIAGLEEKIAKLHELFSPEHTPTEFLPWLASWVALDLHSDLPLARRRSLLANIVPLYQIRGTKQYLEELLRLHLDAPVSVDDSELPPFQIEVHSSLGKDTYLAGGPPYFFRVRLDLSGTDREREAQSKMARDVIELAKPAHTIYSLEVIRREAK